jgi:Fe2+ transport system protein FeoA
LTTLAPAAPGTPVTCALCGFQFVPGGDACREHGCPLALGVCATRHCPRCGYVVPDEERSVAVRLLRRLLRRRPEAAGRTLAGLSAGAEAVVERLQGSPELQTRLTAQGLAPGVRVHLLQRAPTFVIEVGETTIAVEQRVAEAIVLRDRDAR